MRPFNLLLLSQTGSAFATQVAMLLIPLLAVDLLGATPWQMGVLTALEKSPYLLLALAIGALVDRQPRFRLMTASEFLSAFAIAMLILVTAGAGSLSFALVAIVGFVTGMLALAYDVSAQSTLPSIVGGSDGLVAANSRVETLRTVAMLIGPAAAGAAASALGDARALWIAITFFLISGVTAALLIRNEATASEAAVQADQFAGLRLIAQNGFLRATVLAAGTINLFQNFALAVYFIFLIRDLKEPASVVGIVVAFAGGGALFGAFVCPRITSALGVPVTMIGGAAASGLGYFLVPIAMLAPAFAAPLLMFAAALNGAGVSCYNINAIAARQKRTPDALRGRVNASARLIAFGSIPIGALLGGATGALLGTPWALILGGAGSIAAVAWLLPYLKIYEPI